MIEVQAIQKSIDKKIILQDISFTIPKGSVVGNVINLTLQRTQLLFLGKFAK